MLTPTSAGRAFPKAEGSNSGLLLSALIGESTMSQAAQANVVRLDYQQRDGTVVVVPADEDRFALTVDEAIKACRAYEAANTFRRQFQILLRKLGEWVRSRRQRVAAAYLTVRDAGLLFLVVTSSASYDARFEDELTELDLAVVEDPNLNLIRLTVLAVPPASQEAVNSFLAPGFTLQYAQ